MAVGGFVAGNAGASVTKNHPTVAQITGGALVEKAIPASVVRDDHIELLLRDPSFTSASRVAAVINEQCTNSAQALDSTTVRVLLPEGAREQAVDFIAYLETLEIVPDVPARIIINERTGTIVATARIRVANCAISHGNITLSVANSRDVSQPTAFSNRGRTAVTTSTTTDVTENKEKMVALPELPTVEKVAAALNSLGVSPRDMMAIFQAMRQAGALQAELLVR
jgi:flagellar P-ring protein precursor FlgI